MSEKDGNVPESDAASEDAGKSTSSGETSSADSAEKSKTTGGVQWEQKPDPMAGVKKGASDVLDKMEGKTVSMKTYVGSIIAVIVLMLLARCGG